MQTNGQSASAETSRHTLNEHFGKHREGNTHEKDHPAQPGIRPSHGRRNAAPTLMAVGAALTAGFLLGRNWPAVAVLLGAGVAVPVAKGGSRLAGAAVHGGKGAIEGAGKVAAIGAEVAAKGAAKGAEVAVKGAEVATGAALSAGAGLATAATVAAKAVTAGAGAVSETGSRAVRMATSRRRPSRRARALMWAGKVGAKMAGRKAHRSARKLWA